MHIVTASTGGASGHDVPMSQALVFAGVIGMLLTI